MQSGDPSANQKVNLSARSYVALLRQHIFKEDRILFPMADHVIPVEQHASVWEGFEPTEHAETGEGVHEKYLALANALEQEAASFAQQFDSRGLQPWDSRWTRGMQTRYCSDDFSRRGLSCSRRAHGWEE